MVGGSSPSCDTNAGLAQVAPFPSGGGQTQTFHLWTWSERRTFNPEVRGSSPRVGTKVLFTLWIGESASESARGARLSSISPVAARLIDYMKLRDFGSLVCLLC